MTMNDPKTKSKPIPVTPTSTGEGFGQMAWTVTHVCPECYGKCVLWCDLAGRERTCWSCLGSGTDHGDIDLDDMDHDDDI